MAYRRPESAGLLADGPSQIPDPGIFMALAVFTFFLGIGFAVVGVRVRQYWLAIWGGMLTAASLAFGLAIALGYG
jgi:hypothetical protein